DSSVIIRGLRNEPGVVALVNRLGKEGLLRCSVLTVYEVEVGMRPVEVRLTQEVLASLEVMTLTREVVARAALEARQARGRGRTLPPIDTMIGATALVHGLTMVTADLRGFQIPGLEVIAV
ncbi:MAG: PIN domain-containing protein, partial [bacterium]